MDLGLDKFLKTKETDPEVKQAHSDLDDIRENREEIVDELITKVAELDLQLEEINKTTNTMIDKLHILVAAKQKLLRDKKSDLVRLQSKISQEQKPDEEDVTTEDDPQRRGDAAVVAPESQSITEAIPASSQPSPLSDSTPKIVVMIFNDGVDDETVKKNDDLCEGWVNRYEIQVEKLVKMTTKNNLFGIRTKIRQAGLIHRMNQGCILAAGTKEELTPIVNGMCKIE